ncbi:protein NOI4 isoform X1 [Camellia sinensis]|uniref:protein NOI4 isoform X1 n=1 Tax=Camellia sinensis TaxID=4442 RepID=UPI0010359BB3|nr:protein NOI4 isoform X1 [Camellia sinensis]
MALGVLVCRVLFMPMSRSPTNNVCHTNFSEKGRPLPKFGEWDVNDPASAEGFTVIFNKARNEKKAGGKPDSPTKEESAFKHGAALGKPQSKKWFCCMQSAYAES